LPPAPDIAAVAAQLFLIPMSEAGGNGNVGLLARNGTGHHGLPTQQQVKVLKEGEFFGEKHLLTELQRRATIVSRDRVATYALDKTHFETALAASQSLKDQVYKAVCLR
jgi:CRP-like cAMP-binding protein